MRKYVLLATMVFCVGTSMVQEKKGGQEMPKEPTAEEIYEKGMTLVEIENLKITI